MECKTKMLHNSSKWETCTIQQGLNSQRLLNNLLSFPWFKDCFNLFASIKFTVYIFSSHSNTVYYNDVCDTSKPGHTAYEQHGF